MEAREECKEGGSNFVTKCHEICFKDADDGIETEPGIIFGH